jgi:hypothetical protein
MQNIDRAGLYSLGSALVTIGVSACTGGGLIRPAYPLLVAVGGAVVLAGVMIIVLPMIRHQPAAEAAAPGVAGALTDDQPGGAPGPQLDQNARRWRRLGWAALVVVTVLAGGALVVWSRATYNPPPPTASESFTVRQDDGQLTVTRDWKLTDDNGSVFTETAVVRASGTSPVLFEDPIPPPIAANLLGVHFSSPYPTELNTKSHTAVWELAGHHTVTIRYWIGVSPAGATKARLDSWKSELLKQLASQGSVKLVSLSIKSRLRSIAINQTVRLRLVGALSNGKPTPKASLAAAKWSASPHNNVIRIVSNGSWATVTGLEAGTVQIRAQVMRSIQAILVITVYSVPSSAGSTSSSQSGPSHSPRPTAGPSSSKIGP